MNNLAGQWFIFGENRQKNERQQNGEDVFSSFRFHTFYEILIENSTCGETKPPL